MTGHHISKASRPLGLLFLFVLYTPEFSIDPFQIHSKFSLGHGVDPSTLVTFVATKAPTWPFLTVYSVEPSFQWIFFKFPPSIHWNGVDPSGLVTFVASRAPTWPFLVCTL